MATKNLRLKFLLLEIYGLQRAAAKHLGIPPQTLSELVCGWRQPSKGERQKFIKAFGREKVKEVFDE